MEEIKETLAKKDGNYLGTESVTKLLLKFALPCVVSMLVSALYNIVDQIFIGQGVGYLGNAATTVVFPFTIIALALALLVGDGSAALFSLSLGKGDQEKAQKAVGNGMVLMIILSVVLTAVGFIFEEQLLWFFGATDACFAYAKEYMTVILIGVPFYIITSALNGVIRADGAPGYAMISTSVGAVINLILDPIAIFTLGLGVKGAAIATIIGQIVTAIMAIIYFRKPKLFKLTKNSFGLKPEVVKSIILLGGTSFVIQIAIVLVSTVANAMVGKYGPSSIYGADIPLSVIGIVMKVFAIVIAFSVGVAVGGQPIIGYNYGAKNYGRVKDTYKKIFILNIIIGVISLLIFELCPKLLISLFGNEGELYNSYAIACFRIFLCGIIFCCIQKASSIFLQFIGKAVKSTILSLLRDVIFLLPGFLILAPLVGVKDMLWAAPIADFLSFVVTIIFIVIEWKQMTKLEQKI